MSKPELQTSEEAVHTVTDPVILTGEKESMTILRVALAAVFIFLSGAVGLKLGNALNTSRPPTNPIEASWPLIGAVLMVLSAVGSVGVWISSNSSAVAPSKMN